MSDDAFEEPARAWRYAQHVPLWVFISRCLINICTTPRVKGGVYWWTTDDEVGCDCPSHVYYCHQAPPRDQRGVLGTRCFCLTMGTRSGASGILCKIILSTFLDTAGHGDCLSLSHFGSWKARTGNTSHILALLLPKRSHPPLSRLPVQSVNHKPHTLQRSSRC